MLATFRTHRTADRSRLIPPTARSAYPHASPANTFAAQPEDKPPPCRPLPSPTRLRAIPTRPRVWQGLFRTRTTSTDGNPPPQPSLPHAVSRRG